MKSVDGLDPRWLTAVSARMHQPPSTAQAPFCAGLAPIGSVGQTLAQRLVASGEDPEGTSLVLEPEGNLAGGQLEGEVTPTLQRLSHALQRAGLVATCLDKPLAVRDPSGQDLGAVERGIARLLT